MQNDFGGVNYDSVLEGKIYDRPFNAESQTAPYVEAKVVSFKDFLLRRDGEA